VGKLTCSVRMYAHLSPVINLDRFHIRLDILRQMDKLSDADGPFCSIEDGQNHRHAGASGDVIEAPLPFIHFVPRAFGCDHQVKLL